MPTLSSGADQVPQHPHQARAVAESFGIDPDRYDRTRPRYPEALIERVVSAAPGRSFLDVGIGTGIEARQFQAAGCEILGVEPDARMAAFARRDGTEVEVARLEDWDPAGRLFDAVISAQAWHWIDPEAGARAAADVLRPMGLLALFWNAAQLPADVSEAVGEVYRRLVPDSLAARGYGSGMSAVDGYARLLESPTAGIRATAAFEEPERWRFDWQQHVSRDDWLDVLPTQGGHTGMPPELLAALMGEVGAAVDALGGAFTIEYSTLAVVAQRV